MRLLCGLLVVVSLEASAMWSDWVVVVRHNEWTDAFPEGSGQWEPWISDGSESPMFRGHGDTWVRIVSTYDTTSFATYNNGQLFSYLPAFTRTTAGDHWFAYTPVYNPNTGTWLAIKGSTSAGARVLRSTDGGVQFAETATPGGAAATDALVVGNRIIAAGNAGLYTSTDDGLSWTNMPYGGLDPSYWGGPGALGAFGNVVVGSNLWAAAPGYWRSADGGATWDFMSPTETPNLNSSCVMVSDTGIMVAVNTGTGFEDTVLRSDDLGLTWQLINVPNTPDVGGMWGNTHGAFVQGKFYIPLVETGPGKLLVSDDGLSWGTEDLPEVLVGGSPYAWANYYYLTATDDTMAIATDAFIMMRWYEADPPDDIFWQDKVRTIERIIP